MRMMKRRLHDLILAILAGISIGIGGTVYLRVENPVAGALLFTVGLFGVCTCSLHLFTGRAGYLISEGPRYLLDLAVTWRGNLLGAGGLGFALRLTRVASIAEKAGALCSVKLGDTAGSVFILSLLCGVLMFIAVDGFRKNEHTAGKYIGLFLCVSAFILCGFEHCVANMFYFSVAGTWSWEALLSMAIMTLGNLAGCNLLPCAKRLFAET